ncbi:hypothetical protein GCM10009853_019070 [Glycomyces scopariae]
MSEGSARSILVRGLTIVTLERVADLVLTARTSGSGRNRGDCKRINPACNGGCTGRVAMRFYPDSAILDRAHLYLLYGSATFRLAGSLSQVPGATARRDVVGASPGEYKDPL